MERLTPEEILIQLIMEIENPEIPNAEAGKRAADRARQILRGNDVIQKPSAAPENGSTRKVGKNKSRKVQRVGEQNPPPASVQGDSAPEEG